jgi:hypothetical protein
VWAAALWRGDSVTVLWTPERPSSEEDGALDDGTAETEAIEDTAAAEVQGKFEVVVELDTMGKVEVAAEGADEVTVELSGNVSLLFPACRLPAAAEDMAAVDVATPLWELTNIPLKLRAVVAGAFALAFADCRLTGCDDGAMDEILRVLDEAGTMLSSGSDIDES